MAGAAPALEKLVINLFAGLGNIPGDEEEAVALAIEVPASGNFLFKQPVELAASASTSINLSTIFEQVTFVGVIDTTVDGAGGLLAGVDAATAAKRALAANGFLAMQCDTTTPPTIYLTAPAGESKFATVVAIGKRV